MNVERASLAEIAEFLTAIHGPVMLRIETSGPTITGRVRLRLDYLDLPEESLMNPVFKLRIRADGRRYDLILRYDGSDPIEFTVEWFASYAPGKSERCPVPWTVHSIEVTEGGAGRDD